MEVRVAKGSLPRAEKKHLDLTAKRKYMNEKSWKMCNLPYEILVRMISLSSPNDTLYPQSGNDIYILKVLSRQTMI